MLAPVIEEIDAGLFGNWLQQTAEVLRGEAEVPVPCGTCVGCCVSSYFIPLRPEDEAARARVPEQLLVHAPGQASDHHMMGYGPDGCCPMFNAGRCIIYVDRPQTCRDYDCRIFAAAGIEAGGPEKRIINQRIRAWRFRYGHETERRQHAAIRTAAAFIRDRRDCFPGGRAPVAPTGIAVLALKAHGVFLDPVSASRPDAQIALAIIQASREFDAGPRIAQPL